MATSKKAPMANTAKYLNVDLGQSRSIIASAIESIAVISKPATANAIIAVIVALFAACIPASAQAIRFDSTTYTTNGSCTSGKQCPVLAIPGATVKVCLPPNCASRAVTYTDASAVTPCSTLAQVTITGGTNPTTCVGTSNAQGEFGFWALPGSYNYYVTLPNGGATYGPYPLSIHGDSGGYTYDSNYQTLALACAAAGTGTLAITHAWTGTPTQSLSCALWFLGNGVIQPANGAVVTIAGTITAPHSKIFDYSAGGTVSLTSSNTEFVPEWWGTNAAAFTAACTAAPRLTISSAWTSLASGSYACAMNFLKGGSIQPTTSATVTLTGSVTAGLFQIFDLSNSGAAVIVSKATRVYPNWFGAVTYTYGGTPVDNCTAFTAATSALPAGGVIEWPAVPIGQAWYSSCAITQTLPAHYRGAGRGDTCATSPTCLVFAAGVSGILNTTTSRGSSVEDMAIASLSSVVGTDNGISVNDSWFYAHNLIIDGFGGSCVFTEGVQAQFMKLEQILCNSPKTDGLHCVAADCGFTTVNLFRVVSAGHTSFYGQWGHSIFTGTASEYPVTSAYDITGLSNDLQGVYCEGGSLDAIMRGTWSTMTTLVAGACNLSNPGGPSNILTQAGTNGSYATTQVGILDLGLSLTGHTYRLFSGTYGAQCFTLQDATSNVHVYNYCPAGTPTWTLTPNAHLLGSLTVDGSATFASATLTDVTVVQSGTNSGLNVYKASAFDAPSSEVCLDGNDGAGTQVHYACLQADILNNTAGSATGGFTLRTRIAGTMTDVLRIQVDGSIVIRPQDGCGGLPTGSLAYVAGVPVKCP